METLVGQKLNMTQLFGENGRVIPVTAVRLESPAFESFGDELVGKKVIVSGTSKGKGFAGGMKRWGFKGGETTRGQSTYPRQAGSIGSQTPGRVRKGKKMAGHMGNRRVAVKGLRVVSLDKEKLIVMVSGPVPGARNSKVSIRLV